MYGNPRIPFVNGDLRTPLPSAPLAHTYYPNYHHYNVPGHSPVSMALAHRYAVAPMTTGQTVIETSGQPDYTVAECDALLRRAGSGERRGSGSSNSARRGSGCNSTPAVVSENMMTTGPPGKKQQRFEILRKLGSGTYGRVSLAMDHKAGEEVAVKVIRKSAIENTADLIRIRREIRIMSALKHPNIIEIKEVFENDEKIILVMEYASGGELYDFVGKHGPLPEDEVRRLFRQIVSAVYYCHMHGVAHRDLKLENILLDKDMGAKIADFGLSNYFTDHSLLRTFCGSPLYASPEIINGTPYKGPEVDCWSLGVLLYTLAYSSMPFDGRDFNRMARQIKRGAYYEPDPPSSSSMLIRSMLRVCPERRAPISDIAAHWWLNFDENGAAIADLPENQVLDSTPLYIRQETMKIQNFGEENEMFAEFTHLSDETRKKIEEFRRRRREAEWYLIECQTPLKKQSKKRSSSIVNEQQKKQSSQAVMPGQKQSRETSVAASGADVMVASRKNSKGSNAELLKQQPNQPNPSKTTFTAAEVAAGEAGGLPDEQLLDKLTDPLNRLKALENRLHNLKEKPPLGRMVANMDDTPQHHEEASQKRPSSLNLAEKPQNASPVSTPQRKHSKNSSKTALKMSVDDLVHEKRDLVQEKRDLDKVLDNATAASIMSAVQEEANRLVNQLLEETMKGTVSQESIDRIRASEAYRMETFVKEILESVLAAQKSVPTPSTPTGRVPRSRSKQSSLTRIPTSGSSSNTNPLPDIISQDSDKISASMPTPDVVAVADVIVQSTVPQPAIIPVPILPTTPLAAMKLIYETVPEDAELQLNSTLATRVEMDTEIAPEPRSISVSSEQEEDVNSTDFEDLEMDEEDEEAARSRRGDDSPLSATGSFASTHSHVGELPEIRTFAPATEGGGDTETKTVVEVTESEDNPFLRGLSKRMSRGKYEKSKFIFGRGVSIEESPRSSRRRMAAERKAAVMQAGKGSLEETEIDHTCHQLTEETPDQLADGQKSPRRRRYSDGDKNHLDPIMARRDDWLKTTDSDMGSSQEVDTPPPEPNPDTRYHYEDLEKKKGEKIDANNEKNDAGKQSEPVQTAEMNSSLLTDSQRRREERAKMKRGFLSESPGQSESTAQNSAAPTEKAASTETVQKEDVKERSPPKDVEKSEPISIPPIDDQKSSNRSTVCQSQEENAPIDPEPNKPSDSVDPEQQNKSKPPRRRSSIPDQDTRKSSDTLSGTLSTAEQRRHSYRTAMENNSLHDSQDGEKNAAPKSATATASGTGRSSRYPHPTTGVSVADPLWLQYAREETRHYKSPYAHAHDRTDEDYYSQRSHLPQNSSYRVGSTYPTRELSPPRSSAYGPVFRSYIDPLESAATAYSTPTPYTHQSSITAPSQIGRGRKPKPLYHQSSTDEAEETKRYSTSTNQSVVGYSPVYSRRTTGGGDYYRSLYDDNVVYRRSHYDVQPAAEPEDTDTSNTNQFRVFQPKGLIKKRSRSLDKTQARRIMSDTNDDQDETSAHYSSNRYETGASVGARQPSVDANSKSQLKSILKKQPTLDTSSPTVYGSRYGDTSERKGSDPDSNRSMNFIERLRRHLSTEKSPEPPDYISGTSSNARTRNDSTLFNTPSENSQNDYATDSNDAKPGRKKRHLMELGRRRTTEVRYGAPNSDEYGSSATKRPTSPIEKIKGFFSGTQKTGTNTGTSTYHYPVSPFSGQPSPFAAYQAAQAAARGEISSNYTPSSGYSRKPYQSGAYRPYAPSSTSRYWFEDNSNLY